MFLDRCESQFHWEAVLVIILPLVFPSCSCLISVPQTTLYLLCMYLLCIVGFFSQLFFSTPPTCAPALEPLAHVASACSKCGASSGSLIFSHTLPIASDRFRPVIFCDEETAQLPFHWNVETLLEELSLEADFLTTFDTFSAQRTLTDPPPADHPYSPYHTRVEQSTERNMCCKEH